MRSDKEKQLDQEVMEWMSSHEKEYDNCKTEAECKKITEKLSKQLQQFIIKKKKEFGIE